MKIFQLRWTSTEQGQIREMDPADVIDEAMAPSQLFLTAKAARSAAELQIKEECDDLDEDSAGTEPQVVVKVEWVGSRDGFTINRWECHVEELDMVFVVTETEVSK